MTTEASANFANYHQLAGINVYDLGDGLLSEMAHATGYKLSFEPTEESLRGLVQHLGPAKTLQDNIGLTLERLGSVNSAVTIAADWAERSGSLEAMHRGFHDDDHEVPDSFDTAVFNTAVGRWQERRANRLIQLAKDGKKLGRVVILGGSRVMAEGEHPYVGELARQDEGLPTESRFAETFIKEKLINGGLKRVEVESVDSTNGDEILAQGLYNQRHKVLGGTVLAVGNAPSTIQVSAQLRMAARHIGRYFDDFGDQLFMTGDSIAVARAGEGPETHQNPFSALGQIARNGLLLHLASQDA